MADKNDNVVVIKYLESSKAYEHLSKLKDNGEVRSAVIVEVGADGKPAIKDGFDTEGGSGTATGGLIGMVIGILGGPLGMLFGLGTGGLIGATKDLGDESDRTGVVSLLVDDLLPGQTAVIAHIQESDPKVLDLQAAEAGAVVERAPAQDVLNDLYALEEQAEEAERAERDADKAERKEEKKEEREAKRFARKQKSQAKLDEINAAS